MHLIQNHGVFHLFINQYIYMQGPYGTRSSAALIVTSSEEVSFFEAYLDEGMWKEHVIDFHIQKLKKLTKGHA